MDASIASHLVVRVLEWPKVTQGLPRMLVLKNGTELTDKTREAKPRRMRVELHLNKPGKREERHVESFSGKFRDGCLNLHWFPDLEDARVMFCLLVGYYRLGFYLSLPFSIPRKHTEQERLHKISWSLFRRST